MSKITGKITSSKGFYIGDICYALEDKTYHEVWGGENYMDGVYEVPGTGRSFAVAGTAYGDGTYEDTYGREYSVDAGNIGLVPAELASRTVDGHYFEVSGTATFEAERGYFKITLPDGTPIWIDTRDCVEDTSWDEDDNEWSEDEDDEDEYFD